MPKVPLWKKLWNKVRKPPALPEIPNRREKKMQLILREIRRLSGGDMMANSLNDAPTRERKLLYLKFLLPSIKSQEPMADKTKKEKIRRLAQAIEEAIEGNWY